MIAAAISKILSLGNRDHRVIDGRLYEVGPGGIVPLKPPRAEVLEISTLAGIVDFDPLPGRYMLHVIDHSTVRVIDMEYINEWMTRNDYVKATHGSPSFRFGQYYELELFIITLQSMFVQDEMTARILQIVGNIKDEEVSNFNDDGVSQSVKTKAGISLAEVTQIPNPVILRPYRTFMEVEQPASKFVFRLKRVKGESPSCALFEADGGAWKLTAIASIRDWLQSKIPGIKIIA